MKTAATTQQPNILLIMTDQQAPGMMSCAGTDWVYTPAIDSIAARGVRFEHAVCANPVCAPSRISMATGMMPARFGGVDNASAADAVLPTPVAAHSLGALMKQSGYATFYGGKVHMCDQLVPATSGYDQYHRNDRETLADACVNFITAARDVPYFAVASFINPHDVCFVHNAKVEGEPRMDHVTDLYRQACELPNELLPPLPENYSVPDVEPPGMRSRTDDTSITPSGTMYDTYTERDWRVYRWIYARLTEAVDTQIGRILAAIDGPYSRRSAAGAARPTVVIFVSDHGNMHANHGLASKGVFYEESIRVPFILADPIGTQAGEVNTTTLLNTGLDILPTCCDYAGVEVPAHCLGMSARRAGAAGPPRRYVAAENDHGRMIRGTRWKYTVYTGVDPRETLTDLAADPGELQNLAGDPRSAGILTEQRELMKEWFELSQDEEGLRDFVVENR